MVSRTQAIVSSLGTLSSTESNQDNRYTNLNLNQNYKCPNFNHVSSINVSSSTTEKKKWGYDDNGFPSRKSNDSSLKSVQKDMPSISSNCYGSGSADKKQKWKKDDDSPPTSKSTLSLHIAAYENSISSDKVNEENVSADASEVTKALSGLSLKQIISGDSSAVIQSPFEFPRQQKDDDPGEPESMQFKASQRLLNPNNPVSPLNIASGNDQSSPDQNDAVAQNVQAAVVPTLFEFSGGKFVRRNEGSEEEVTFVFGDGGVIFEGDENLDPIALEFDGDRLLACYVDENVADEVIRGLKLTETLEVLTDTSSKGPYNQIRHLLNRSSNERIDGPNQEDLFNFLVDYRNVNTEGGNVVPKPVNVHRKDKPTKPQGIKNSEFQKQKLTNIKSQLVGLAAALPQPESIILPVDSLLFDPCIRRLSEFGSNAIYAEMVQGTWKPENNIPLAVNRINGRYHVFKGKKRLQAIKKLRAADADPKHEYVKCHVYDGLDLSQKVLIAKPTTGATTIIQKLKLQREVVETLGITLPKGKILEEKYSEIMDLIFHNDYPSILTSLLELPSAYLDQLCNFKCGEIPLEEFRLESSFWDIFLSSCKKNPSEALKALQTLESKAAKDVEKILKKVPLDLLFYLAERGPHNFESEEAAILFFTGDAHCSKKELMKKFAAARIDKNKGRMLGSYDWDAVKAKIDGLVTDELVYSNAEYFDKITPTLISEQDFIIIQNPTKPQLELIQSSGNKAVIMLLGNCGVPAPQLPNTAPTATIKIVMESPILIHQILTSLPDPVANASIYLPGAPAGDQIQKTRFLSSVAMEKGCSLASTMTLENSHQIADLVETKTKAAFCFVTEKVARHFMSNCADYEEISVVGDASLREIVHSVAGPPPKKRRTNDKEVDNNATNNE